jgi:two-component system sensor histidine kinase HydH
MAFRFRFQRPRPVRGASYSPWLILGVVAVLLVVVAAQAVENINREKQVMSKILAEKGAALIRAVEAGARTGMMGMLWGGDQVQMLVEETARLPDVLYLAVTDAAGRILAHNDRSRLGEAFPTAFSMERLRGEHTLHWHLVGLEDGRRAFEVYRQFQPISNAEFRRRRGGRTVPGRMGGPGRPSWCLPEECGGAPAAIFIGLDVAPFEAARRVDMRNTLVISAVLLLLGVGSFGFMLLAHHYRAARRQLQDTSAFADEVVSNLPVGLIATDAAGRIAFLNEAAERITRLRSEAVRGKDPGEVLPAHWCGLREALEQGTPVIEQEMECRFADGQPVPVSISAARIVNEEGGFVGHLLILRDLGEVRRLQQEIRRQEKLAALGSLSAGVAHEIRNPLSSIKGLAAYFGAKFPTGSEDRQAADVMIGEVERLNRVVSELLEFARPSDLNFQTAEVNAILEHSLKLIQPDAAAQGVRVDFQPGPGLAASPLDPDRFVQALLNLYLNALQAMAPGGVLTVRSGPGPGGGPRVEIQDTGTGIPPEEREKIFDPYFTTKPTGTGLGLAIVHKIIEAHGGRIAVDSRRGGGTAITVDLPGDQGRTPAPGEP